MRSNLLLFAAAAAGLASAAGCDGMNTPIYFNGTMVLTTTGQGANGMQERLRDAVPLRFRNPSDTERMALNRARDAADPVKVPWISRDNVHIQVTYTVTNTSDEMGVFNVSVNGATEFIKYDEDVVAAALAQGDDELVFLPLMQSRPQMLGPHQTYQGLFREDDFVEATTDLNAIDQFMANFAAVVINRSDANPLGLEMVPKTGLVVPAMIEIDLTFTADQAMTCQYLVRVRDDDDQLLHEDGDTRFAPEPALFAPMIAP